MNRLKIVYTISFNGLWHIGSGKSFGFINRSILRDSQDNPFIPGSALKGVTRNICETLATSYEFLVADPHSDLGLEGFKPSRNAPLVSRLFGSRYDGDCLFFSDACWNKKEMDYYRSLHISEITRIQMDRASRTAKSGHLFSSEYVHTPDLKLQGRIDAEHEFLVIDKTVDAEKAFPWEYSFLIMSLHMLNRIGGDKSTGKGKVAVTIDTITYQGNIVDQKLAFDIFKLSNLLEEYNSICELLEGGN